MVYSLVGYGTNTHGGKTMKHTKGERIENYWRCIK